MQIYFQLKKFVLTVLALTVLQFKVRFMFKKLCSAFSRIRVNYITTKQQIKHCLTYPKQAYNPTYLAGGFMVFPQHAFLGFPQAMVLKEQHQVLYSSQTSERIGQDHKNLEECPPDNCPDILYQLNSSYPSLVNTIKPLRFTQNTFK